MNLSEPFIRRPVMTALLTLSAIVFGFLAYKTLPVNDLPAVDYPVIQVNVGYPGASPQTMANNVATPLERQFMQIPGLDLVTSTSGQGNTALTLQFNLSKSVDAAATDVQAAITQATGLLPADLPSPPTFSKTNPNDQPIMYIGLTSDTFTKGQLYDFASTQVGERISILPGVSRVITYGTPSAVRIKADPSALDMHNFAIDDLANAIRNGTAYQGAGQFDGPSKTFLLQPQGQLATAEEYNNLVIGYRNNAPVFLRDVAKARDTVQDERVDMRFWVRGTHVPSATVVVAVFRQAGANAVEVAKAVRDLAPLIQATLPPSIRIVPIYDRSQTIVNSVRDVQETLYIAFVLVVLVIFFFLGRATDTLIPVVALPLSILLTFIAMNALGYSIDNLSLMALVLAIGFLVDDAIVFLENTVRLMEQGQQPMEAAFNSAREISFTILSMTISLAAVFIPLVFMGGLVGRIFREFSITIIIAIFASGIVSLTLTPMMCSRLLKARGHGIKKSWVERIIGSIEKRVLGFYGRTLYFFLDHKWISLILWCICMSGTVYLFMLVPKSFLPIGDSSFIWGAMIAQEGSSPEQMHKYQGEAEKVMQENPSVDMTFSMTGLGQFVASNQGFLIAFLKNPEDRPPFTVPLFGGRFHLSIHPPIGMVAGQMMGGIMTTVPGVFAYLQPQPVLQISTGATARTQGNFAYAISGIDANQVDEVATKLVDELKKNHQIFLSVNSDLFTHTPSLQIDIQRDKAATYGVSVNRIETLIRNAYSQNYVYLIKQTNNQYQVILEVNDKDRSEPQDLSLLYVRSDDSQRLVPLSAVAKWHTVLGPQSVNHINQFPSVTIFFNVVPGVPTSIATDYVDEIAKQIVPTTLRGDFQGEALTFRNTVHDLTILMLLAVFVMYVILGILYESYLHPITVLSSLPVALVGGLATLFLFNAEASLYAFIGMFMLMGIVKKNGIMIVDFAIQRIAQGQTAEQAIHDASMDRFRPIIMTTMAAVMGAIPIALGFGADGASRRPLGLVIVGGLIVSQLITLYVTPAIYLYLELIQEHVLDRFSFTRNVRTHPGMGTGHIPHAGRDPEDREVSVI